MMLRVCHIISGDLWAGAEVMACHLLKELQSSSDLRLQVILLNEGRLADELIKDGLSVHVFDESRTSFLRLAQNIRRLLAGNPLDIIHSHRYKENLLAFLVSRGRGNVRLISTQHGLPETYDQSGSLAWKIKSRANFFALKKYFNTVVAVSEDIRSFFIKELGFARDKIRVARNGIQIPEKIDQKSNVNDFIIGSSGRLFSVKDYPLMVTVAQVLSGHAEIRFVLAGEGPERTKLEKAIRESGLEKQFILKGHQDNMDDFYRELDIYINTSVHEGIPMTILEAMARGLPIIAPKVGGIPEVVQDEVEGFLIQGRDPLAFAEKCLLLYKDKALRNRVSQAARDRAISDFSVERMTRKYLDIYHQMAKH